MSKQIKILIDPVYLTELAIELTQLEGIEVEIQEKASPEPRAAYIVDKSRKHPFYSLEFTELCVVIVSISSVITSLVGLATVILDLKSKTKETQHGEEKSLSIIINNYSLDLSNFSSPDKLATFLEELLKKAQNVQNFSILPDQKDSGLTKEVSAGEDASKLLRPSSNVTKTKSRKKRKK